MQGDIKRTFRFKLNPINLLSVLFLAQSAPTSLPPRNHLTLRIGFDQNDLLSAAKAAKADGNRIGNCGLSGMEQSRGQSSKSI